MAPRSQLVLLVGERFGRTGEQPIEAYLRILPKTDLGAEVHPYALDGVRQVAEAEAGIGAAIRDDDHFEPAADQLVERQVLKVAAVRQLHRPALLAEEQPEHSAAEPRSQEVWCEPVKGIDLRVWGPVAEPQVEQRQQSRDQAVARHTTAGHTGVRVEGGAGDRHRRGKRHPAAAAPEPHLLHVGAGATPAGRVAPAEKWRENEVVTAATPVFRFRRLGQHNVGVDEVIGPLTSRPAHLLDQFLIRLGGRTPSIVLHVLEVRHEGLHQAIAIHAVQPDVVQVDHDADEGGDRDEAAKPPERAHRIAQDEGAQDIGAEENAIDQRSGAHDGAEAGAKLADRPKLLACRSLRRLRFPELPEAGNRADDGGKTAGDRLPPHITQSIAGVRN